MSNTNQLKKAASHKYVLLFFALMAFMVSFQAVAQKKQQHKKSIENQHYMEIVIDKNTSDAEIKNGIEKLNKGQGGSLEFSKIERNKQGQIIAIKGQNNYAFGKKGTPIEIKGDGPIKPIRFYKSDNGGIGFDHSGNTIVIDYHSAH